MRLQITGRPMPHGGSLPCPTTKTRAPSSCGAGSPSLIPRRTSLFGTRYAIVVDNNHFTDLYGCAYGIPASIITKKIQPALHNPDRKPTKRTADLGERAASVSGLIEATVDAGLPPLVLGTMSQLFGGMTNALPVGYPPILSWEGDRQEVCGRTSTTMFIGRGSSGISATTGRMWTLKSHRWPKLTSRFGASRRKASSSCT